MLSVLRCYYKFVPLRRNLNTGSYCRISCDEDDSHRTLWLPGLVSGGVAGLLGARLRSMYESGQS
jgi:hypothetical protein